MALDDTSKRSGKFRHIYGEPAKPEGQFLELKKPLTSGEGSYVKANDVFWAVSKSSGGGQLYIKRLDQPGRLAPNEPCLAPSAHKGKIWDFDFHPFVKNIIATAGDDCRICVNQFPVGGLTDNVVDSLAVLEGHGKKVALTQFHPSANMILASGGFDRCVKVWNIETQQCVSTYDQLGDNIYSLEWNQNGSQLAATGKDKKLRIFDPRKLDDEVSVIESFDGAKSNKCFWLPRLGWIGAVGFSKQAKRQLKLWDLKNLDKPVYSQVLDQAASVLMPHWDDDHGVLYLAGKGEASVSFSEIVNNDKKVYTLGVYRKGEPQKGGGWVPKRGLDVWKCEIQRFMKLTQKSVVPVSIICPRKAGGDVFQEDIYPDAPARKAAMTADEWVNGGSKDPIMTSLNPAKREADEDDQGAVMTVKKSYKDLEDENAKLRAQVAELKKKLGIEDEPEPEPQQDDEKQDDDNNDAVEEDEDQDQDQNEDENNDEDQDNGDDE